MSSTDANKIITRTLDVYMYLVDETENPTTLKDRRKSKTLSFLLDLIEYIRLDSDENPLPDFFE